MRHPGFSIAGLMMSVGVVAIIFAALRDPSALWASILFSMILACLASAAVLAICSRGRARAAWAGMAAFGLVYVHFGFGDPIGHPPLVTGYLLDFAAERMIGLPGREIAYYSREGRLQTWDDPKAAIDHSTRSVPVNSVDLLAYRQIGHSAIGLLAGLVGAAVGLIAARRNEQPEGTSAG
jgi:hypothetical protein